MNVKAAEIQSFPATNPHFPAETTFWSKFFHNTDVVRGFSEQNFSWKWKPQNIALTFISLIFRYEILYVKSNFSGDTKNCFPTSSWNLIMNDWMIEICSNTWDTHLLLVFLLELCRKPLKICSQTNRFYSVFSDCYNWISFSMENFQNFRYGLSLCLKMVHLLGVWFV
jgi:hypothetical protein